MGFEGTASELKKKLEEIAPVLGIDIKDRDWPKKPNGITRIINVIMHTLKEAGIVIEYEKTPDSSRTKLITIRKVSPEPSKPSVTRAQSQVKAHSSDDMDDMDDTDDTLHIEKGGDLPEFECDYCKKNHKKRFKTNELSEYEAHMFKHNKLLS